MMSTEANIILDVVMLLVALFGIAVSRGLFLRVLNGLCLVFWTIFLLVDIAKL